MRRCTLCLEFVLDASYPPDVNVCASCEEARHGPLEEDLTVEMFTERSGWRYAVTMPDHPHEYTVRDLSSDDAHGSTCLSHQSFEWFVRKCQEEGREEAWYHRTYRYLRVGDYEYWTHGFPPRFTTIINRRPVTEEARATVEALKVEAEARRSQRRRR